jgi:hypothetical protein
VKDHGLVSAEDEVAVITRVAGLITSSRFY